MQVSDAKRNLRCISNPSVKDSNNASGIYLKYLSLKLCLDVDDCPIMYLKGNVVDKDNRIKSYLVSERLANSTSTRLKNSS